MPETPSVLQPVELSARELFCGALEYCARHIGVQPRIVLERLRSCDPQMHGALRYGLAKGLGEYLGGLGVAFRAIYVYGSAMGDASSPCSDLDIILELEHDADAVDRLMRGLDVALVTQFRALFPWARNLVSLLDVRTVTPQPNVQRNRYSGGFAGIGTSPVCLWRSTPETTGVLRTEDPRRSAPATAR